MPRVFDPRNDKLFDTVSGYFSAESLENRVIARPVRKLVVAIRSPQCGALHWPQANHKLTDKSEFGKQKSRLKAVSHRDLYAPKRPFFHNTAQKIHGRRQPYRGLFSCLEEKLLTLECFAVLKRRFLLTGRGGERRNTLCISRSSPVTVGKKIPSKPCKSLWEPA